MSKKGHVNWFKISFEKQKNAKLRSRLYLYKSAITFLQIFCLAPTSDTSVSFVQYTKQVKRMEGTFLSGRSTDMVYFMSSRRTAGIRCLSLTIPSLKSKNPLKFDLALRCNL